MVRNAHARAVRIAVHHRRACATEVAQASLIKDRDTYGKWETSHSTCGGYHTRVQTKARRTNMANMLVTKPQIVTGSKLNVVFRLDRAEATEVYNTYWRFAAERQAVFFRRLRGEAYPWTPDPVLLRHKFTNAYRASDRVSQYLIKHVIYEGDQSPEEVFFRIVLFKVFNRPETWELLNAALGHISYADYRYEKIDAILSQALADHIPIFSAAYMMPSGVRSFGEPRKHRNYLRLLEQMLADEVPKRLSDVKSLRQAFELLRSYPMIGDFLAYQYAIDINYSRLTDFSEMDYVVPGPGARSGIRKCFRTPGGLSESDIIRAVADKQEEEFSRLGLQFETLWGRRLQLVDCQNLFCETDKYARIVHPNAVGLGGRTCIKQVFRPRSSDVRLWYPPKWEINELVARSSIV